MSVAVESKVPFILDNVQLCQCPKCPVQQSSQCVKQLGQNLQQAIKKQPLKHEEIPGLYCGGGSATCNDLSYKNACLCGTCSVFNEKYHLADNNPAGYFCKGGKAV
ncbi:MAG TPA: hypothetical protein VF790_14335 [Dissulfurispiraceae bacterium]